MEFAVCDDLEEERRLLKSYLSRYRDENNLDITVTEYCDAESLLKAYKAGNAFDVIFLDVYMDKTDGITAAKKLTESGFNGSIIFCTTSKDHAIAGFELDADDYLLKPYTYERFLKSAGRFEKRYAKSRKSITFKSERLEYSIFLSDIVFIETIPHGTEVYTKNQTLKTRRSLGEFEKDIKDESAFLKVSRSYIVNMNYIKSMEGDSLCFENGTSIPLPVREKQKLKNQINEYFWKKVRNNG